MSSVPGPFSFVEAVAASSLRPSERCMLTLDVPFRKHGRRRYYKAEGNLFDQDMYEKEGREQARYNRHLQLEQLMKEKKGY